MFRLTAVMLAFVIASTVRADDKPVAAGDDDLVKKVRASIDDAVAFLRSKQDKASGSWERNEGPTYNGGKTALALLALLNAGVKPDDPAVAKGLDYLRKVAPSQTYVVGLQTMVLCQAKQKGDHAQIIRNVKWLQLARVGNGWSYGATGEYDNSNTQYALLGLHEAAVHGFAVDPKALEAMQAFFVKTQSREGGWGYSKGDSTPRFTMTSAGLCNLLITGMDLAAGKASLRADGSAEKCGEYADNKNVVDALNWIGDRFPAKLDDATAYDRFKSPFYAMYGIERAGRISGRRFLGGHDWYEIGCRHLVNTQKADGSWQGIGAKGAFDHWPVVATSFALLHIAKGRTPVLITKMAYGAPDYTGWDNKRSDVRHVADFCSRELFKYEPMAWQVFDVRGPGAATPAERKQLAAQLLQSPVVFVNGHDVAPRDKHEEILKEYLAAGGFLFAEACCGRKEFDRDFRRMIKNILPDAEIAPLEPEHPIWTASGKFAVSPKDFPLEGVKQGCKTIAVYSPVPLSGYWEGDLHKEGRGKKAFELAANVVAYATGLEAPRPRLTRVEIAADGVREPVKRGMLRVGQLRHEGDWKAAPQAMRNVMAECRKLGLDVLLKTEAVFPTEEAVLDHPFLYMHGRGKFASKRADLKHLRFQLKNGGTLFADACCGSKAFDESFREMVKELFAEDKLSLEAIRPDDPLFAAELGGKDLRTVRRRSRGADGRAEKNYRAVPPDLEGVKYRGRWVVIYSRYDIGCALEKRTSTDCLGHDPTSAMDLARAAVLYALRR